MFSNAHMTFMAGTVVEDKKILSCKKISVKSQNSEGPKYNNPGTQTRHRRVLDRSR